MSACRADDGVTARLRGHHLVCLQFYRGEGYSPEFISNVDRVLSMATETPALIVSGGDDICSACPGLAADGTCTDPGEDEVLSIDALALTVLDAAIGESLSLADALGRLESDAAGVGRWRAEACSDCTWEVVCEDGWKQLFELDE